MQHNLLKKYQDEVNANTVKQDLINHMNLELEEYESKCKSFLMQIDELKQKLEQMISLEDKYKNLLIDHEELKIKCRTYKNELKCFDEKFFEEIEDLKYNYAESVKLNKYYEFVLNQVKKNNCEKMLKDRSNDDKKKEKHRVKFVDINQSTDEEEDNKNEDYEKSHSSSDSEINFLEVIENHYKKIGGRNKSSKIGENQNRLDINDHFNQYSRRRSRSSSRDNNTSFDFDKFIGIDSLIVNDDK
jgi:hypothetical protein